LRQPMATKESDAASVRIENKRAIFEKCF